MTDYTPTTEEVRGAYEGQLIKVGNNAYQLLDEAHAKAEFERWLAEVKAQAWEEGYTQGNNDMYNGDFPTHNPYRQEEGSENSNFQPTAETPNYLNLEGEEQ